MSNNPWAGLASYQDPASGSTLLFCGRDNESYDLAALVDDNIFCTLYGKSGTGKTSLLNAGMFPRLRDMGYLPLSIRLGMEALGSTFQQCIAARLGKAATLQTADTVPLPADDQDEQWLWAWFARTRFVDTEGKVRFPVLVFDQFEEVFRSRRTEAETLLRQVHFMMDPSHSLGDDYDYNFRFLASIREDDLYLLEDSLDRHFMGDMKQCRYRLNALTDEGARDVILKPGEGLFAAGEQDAIVDTIIGIARSADGSINTNILSLVCSRIYDHYQRSGDSHISLDLVKRFVSSNPFEQFYNEVTENLGEKEKQFIEDRLVDAAGRRGSVSEPDFEKNVPNGAHLLEGTGRILQRVASGTEGRSYRIELIHDSFCAPLADQKLKRAARRRRRITIAVSILALIVAAVAAYIIVMSIRNARQTREILIQQEKFYAKQASQLLDEGDTYTALLLLNELTDPTGPFAKIPLQPEAECQMRRAVQMHDEAEWQVKSSWRFEDYIVDAQVTPNGKYLIYSTIGSINVVDNKTGYLIKTFKIPSFNMVEPQFTISHNGQLIAAQAIDWDNNCSDLFIYNIDTGETSLIRLLNYQNHDFGGTGGGLSFSLRSPMFFSPDDNKIIHIVDTLNHYSQHPYRVRAYDIATGNVCYDFEMEKNSFPFIAEEGNANGNYVAILNTDKNVVIYDKTSGKILHQIQIGDCLVWKYISDNILLVIREDAVYEYNIPNKKWGKIIDKKFDMKLIGDAQASETNLLMSNGDTIFLYDISNYKMKSYYKVENANNKYKKIVLDKNRNNNFFLILPSEGKIISLEHQQKQETKEITDFHYCFTAFLGDSLLLKMTQRQGSSGYSHIAVHRVIDNKILYHDSVEGVLTFDDVSPSGRYALYTLINYKYNKNGDIISQEEDPSSGLIWKLVDIRNGSTVTVGDTVEYWRYPFFIDDDNFVFYNQYDELTNYNITDGDTSSFMKDVDVMYPKSRTNDGLLLCSDWYIFNPKEKKATELKGCTWRSAKFLPDGKHILATTPNGVVNMYQWSGEELTLLDKRKGRVSDICAISLDNKYAVFVSGLFGRFELWRLFPLHLVDEIDNNFYQSGNVIFDSQGNSILFYSEATTTEGNVGFVRIPILSLDNLKARVQELAGGRKLTEEEKNLLME